MKAIVTSEIVGIMLVTSIIFGFFVLAVPQILSVIAQTFSGASAENVARQTSNLITISGAAAGEIKIDYTPTTQFVYDINIKSRSIEVVPKFEVSYAEKATSTQPFAVNLQDYQITNVNHFIVEKNFNGVSNYVFESDKA